MAVIISLNKGAKIEFTANTSVLMEKRQVEMAFKYFAG
jgi:hypothetical protein